MLTMLPKEALGSMENRTRGCRVLCWYGRMVSMLPSKDKVPNRKKLYVGGKLAQEEVYPYKGKG